MHQTHRMIAHGLRLLKQQGVNLSLSHGIEQQFASVEADEVHRTGLAQLAQGRQCRPAAGEVVVTG